MASLTRWQWQTRQHRRAVNLKGETQNSWSVYKTKFQSFKNIQPGKIQQLKYLGKLDSTVKSFSPFNFDFKLLLIFLSKVKDYKTSIFHLGNFPYNKAVNISLPWHKTCCE